jgi:hypothetical protein
VYIVCFLILHLVHNLWHANGNRLGAELSGDNTSTSVNFTSEHMAQVQEAIAHLTLVDKLYNTGDAYNALKTHGTSGINHYVWNSLR